MKNKPPRRGIAMILVMSVVVIVSVMAAGIIASTSIKSHIGPDMADRAKASALADSGIDIAAYYLENPMFAPSLCDEGYWTGVSNMNLGEGTVDITIVSQGSNIYCVASRGKITRGSSAIQQTSTSTLKVYSYFNANNAVTFNAALANLTSRSTITGSVRSTGIIWNWGRIIGNVKALDLLNLGILDPGSTFTPGVYASTTPTAANLKDFSTYTYNGALYAAETITTTSANSTLGPSAANPLGVYHCAGNLTLNNNVTINGSLIVDGNLNLNGTSTITSQKNIPALIVKGDATTRSTTSKTLTVYGLTWLGGSLKSANSSPQIINFNGTLLFGGVGSVDSNFAGTINVSHDASTIGQMILDTSAPTPSVTFLQYGN